MKNISFVVIILLGALLLLGCTGNNLSQPQTKECPMYGSGEAYIVQLQDIGSDIVDINILFNDNSWIASIPYYNRCWMGKLSGENINYLYCYITLKRTVVDSNGVILGTDDWGAKVSLIDTNRYLNSSSNLKIFNLTGIHECVYPSALISR